MLCGSLVMWPMAFDARGCEYVAAIATPPLLAAGTLLALPLDVVLLSWTLGCEVGCELGAALDSVTCTSRRAKRA